MCDEVQKRQTLAVAKENTKKGRVLFAITCTPLAGKA